MTIEQHGGNNRAMTMVTERDVLSGSEVVGQEAGAGALAQAMVAQVQARWVMAMRRPRNMDVVRQELLRECDRPSFAKSAWFRKPIGQGVEGFSIRFVEAALRIMHNVYVDAVPVSDDADKRVFLLVVTDLESNTTYTEPVTVSKSVEKKKPDEGVKVISSRKNSYGEWTYLVPASDDEILNKVGALKSKAIRTAGKRLIPGDLQDECEKAIKRTRMDDAARDPDAERKSLIDAFDALRVPAAALSDYLGHDLSTASPAELVDLRAVYTTIRDGEANWVECLAASPYRTTTAPVDGKVPVKDSKIQEVANKIKDRAERMRGPKKPPAGASQGSPPSTAAAAPPRDSRPDDGALSPEQERAAFEGEQGPAA